MSVRISVKLTQAEIDALSAMARQEKRDLREQAAMMIHAALVLLGRLPVDGQAVGLTTATDLVRIGAAELALVGAE